MSQGRPDLRDQAEYALLRILTGGFRRLPARVAYRAGEMLGEAARRAGYRREIVASHLSAAFPDRSSRWIEETAAAAYRHFGREAVAVTRLGGGSAGAHGSAGGAGSAGSGGAHEGSRRDPDRRLRERAVEEFRSAYRERVPEGSGAVLVTGHLGNWEVAASVVGEAGVPAVAVVKDQRNPRVNRWIRRLRASSGVETVPLYSASRRLVRAVIEGELVLLVADQDARDPGIFVEFMGRPAATFRGPASLSLRRDVPLLFGALVREGPEPLAPYRVLVETVDRSGLGAGHSREKERELTRRWVAVLEREVRKRPGQYLWFHRRWKTQPPG